MEDKNPFEERRISLGLTQAGLAQRCIDLGVKVGDSQISKIERGICTPNPGLRHALAQILGHDPVTLQPGRQVITTGAVAQ